MSLINDYEKSEETSHDLHSYPNSLESQLIDSAIYTIKTARDNLFFIDSADEISRPNLKVGTCFDTETRNCCNFEKHYIPVYKGNISKRMSSIGL